MRWSRLPLERATIIHPKSGTQTHAQPWGANEEPQNVQRRSHLTMVSLSCDSTRFSYDRTRRAEAAEFVRLLALLNESRHDMDAANAKAAGTERFDVFISYCWAQQTQVGGPLQLGGCVYETSSGN